MYNLKLCETREYSPRQIEHWLHSIQNHKSETIFILKNDRSKTRIYCNKDISPHLPGSRAIKEKAITTNKAFFVTQSSLLPIKRPAQFEDRVNKVRIYPMNTLVQEIALINEAAIKIQFTPIKDGARHRALNKAKKTYFKAERKFDQWETKAWFKISPLRFLGPLIRIAVSKIGITKNIEEQTESLHEREDPRRALLDKLSRPQFKVELSMSHNFDEFINGFNLPFLGSLKVQKKRSHIILSAEELASIMTLPDPKETAPFLQTEPTAYFPMPENALEMSYEDRQRHIYIIGKTGMGKSTAMQNLLKQDLSNKQSIVILDPHGDLISDSLKLIPASRKNDLIIVDPTNQEYPIALNPVELGDENPNLKASALLEMFYVLSQGSWGPRLEYILRNTLLTLLLAPNTTLLDLPRFLTQKNFAKKILSQIKDQELERFWNNEFFNTDLKVQQEYISPILNKVGPLITSPLLRNIFGQPKSKINMENYLNSKKIVLIPLSKGKIGEDGARILGMIFIAIIQSALLKRTEKHMRIPVSLFIDEFQNFSTRTLMTMLSESRKYGLALTIANQYLSQLPLDIQDSILGNVGSLLCFRTSYLDAQKLAPQLNLNEEDLTQLEPFKAYAKLIKDSKISSVFRLDIEEPKIKPEISIQNHLLSNQERLGRKRHFVEEKLQKRYTAAKSKQAT